VTALKPAEIVVVVNRTVDESVALGRFYCDKRGVPTRNLIPLTLPSTGRISSADYDALLRDPLRKALADRGLTDKVQCLLTVYGVPWRLAPGPPPPEITRMVDWYRAVGAKAERLVAANIMRMEAVGSHFPPTATAQTDVADLASLFQDDPQVPPGLPDMNVLRGKFSQATRQKVSALGQITDPTQRAIAVRQIVGLYLNTFGLGSWESIVQMLGDQSPMVPADYKRKAAQRRDEARRLMGVKRPGQAEFDQIEANLLASEGAVGLYDSVVAMAVTTGNRGMVDSRAAVDSELALLLWSDYPRESWADNPLLWVNGGRRQALERQYGGRALMTSRIDGPTVASVVRMVLDSIAVEQVGLTGRVYLDATGSEEHPYDRSLRELERKVSSKTDLPVVLEDTPLLFAPGECPDAALYAGWYSPRMYVESFTFTKGAVAFHMAEQEAQFLHDPKSPEWGPRLITDGVAATVAAAEPTRIQGVPLPSWFLGLILSGEITICEAYWRTIRNMSWRVMLIADPLYNPFKKNPYNLAMPRLMLPEATD